MKNICVYCGSSDKIPELYLEAAREMGRSMAKNGYRLVYGGGKTGIMGTLASSVLEAGGEVIGVIPEMFNTPVLVHATLTQLEVVPNMHLRKARMAELADGFIALPGGFGTFEELFEMVTWSQIGIHHKPIGILNVGGYYDPLLNLVVHASDHGFIYPEHQELLLHAEKPADLLEAMQKFERPASMDRWVERPDSE